MPPKPTYRVVKRAGKTGARINPKGCTVRTEKSVTGELTSRNKAGQTKIKRKEYSDRFTLTICSVGQQSVPNGWLMRTEHSKANYNRIMKYCTTRERKSH